MNISLQQCPWSELDREQGLRRHNPLGGIGGDGIDPLNTPDYGGRVTFSANLIKIANTQDIRVELNKPVLGSSYRFARRYGSEAFIRLRIDDGLLSQNSGLDKLLFRPFVIFSRVFRGFYFSEGTLFLFRTNEEFIKGEIRPPRSGHNSWLSLLLEHNPYEFNDHQVPYSRSFEPQRRMTDYHQYQSMCKWAARIKLALSNSVPGIQLSAENIRFLPDIGKRNPCQHCD